MPLLHRIRWPNVARAAFVVAAIALVVAWPRLRAEPPALPTDPVLSDTPPPVVVETVEERPPVEEAAEDGTEPRPHGERPKRRAAAKRTDGAANRRVETKRQDGPANRRGGAVRRRRTVRGAAETPARPVERAAAEVPAPAPQPAPRPSPAPSAAQGEFGFEGG